MGSGKTSAAITFMNEHPENKFLYVTPYLAEVERIKQACPGLFFTTPSNAFSSKLDNLHELLSDTRNIVSTHALFGTYTPYTRDLIKNGGYTLIMDEVFSVITPMKFSISDINIMLDSGAAKIDSDGEHVIWVDESYDGLKFADVKQKALCGNLIRYKNKLMYWTFPVDTFEIFDDVYILTYLFGAQVQRYYYDMHKISYTFIGTTLVDGRYSFADRPFTPDYARGLKDKIVIVEDEKVNSIGDNKFALSSSWYKNASRYKKKPLIDTMRKNLHNVFRNRFCGQADQNMWTCFKSTRDLLAGGGYTKGFVPCNARATNEYAGRRNIAYCVNIFVDPDISGYFRYHNISIDEDTYALSEMIQWIWRSAIRNGEEINLYIPSKRMRTLLQSWLDDLSKS